MLRREQLKESIERDDGLQELLAVIVSRCVD